MARPSRRGAVVSSHVCSPRPGENQCFVCGRNLYPPYLHEMVIRTQGEDSYEECRTCCVEWPCPAIKAITRNAKKARDRKKR